MKSLQEHLVVPIDDSADQRAQLVYAPNEHVKLLPFAFSYVRLTLYCLLALSTGGLLLIVSVWFPQIFTRLARKRLPYSAVGDADYMLILIHEDGWRSQWVERPVHRPAKNVFEDRVKLRWTWFEFKKHRYVYNHERGEFERYVASIREDLDRIRSRMDTGLDVHTVGTKIELFGINLVDIDKPKVAILLFTKLVHPFYLFQVFSAIVWFFQEYTLYAIVILVLSAFSMCWEIYSEVSNSNRLRRLVHSDQQIEIVRASTITKVHETELVPGDIVLLSTGSVCADILLLSGACIADEASLTGEALPVNKEPVAASTQLLTVEYATTHCKASVLHAGSTITRVRESADRCCGVILSTGFSTGKGELFRSIIFPKPITFAFEYDSYRYLLALCVLALAAFTKRVVEGAQGGSTFGETLINSLDLITIAVPPALPVVLSSGIGFALNRLKKGGIFCIDSQRVNSCGQLSCFCFDKTGTLTQEHLTLIGVETADSKTLALQHTDDLTQLSWTFQLAMATCHGLSEQNGELQGYSLEMAMFEASNFTIEYLHDTSRGSYLAIVTTTADHNKQQQFGVLKRFPFDASCQRSSVVIEDLITKQRYVFVKGSPEAIRAISTYTPQDVHTKLLSLSAEGYYCIGFGMKQLAADAPLDKLLRDRSAVESQVEFMGLALFKNEVKPESKGMLAELYVAEIDVRIITGDNALTAVHVSRELDMKLKKKVAVVDVDEVMGNVMYHCVDAIRMNGDSTQWQRFTSEIISEVLNEYDIAITGAALDKIRQDCSKDTIQHLIKQTLIFARIRPQQKAWIVEQLIDLGLIVGMCGDGTNDCGALKAAHVGLALSSAEASIVAPFTSKAKAILDVPVLIREGRCALMTSFLGFKFMVLYPVIQLTMASTLAQVGTNADLDLLLSNNQYMWDDMAIVLGLAIAMLYTRAATKLSQEKPPSTLFSLRIVASLAGQITLFVAFFAAQFAWMTSQSSWFCSVKDGYAYVEEGDTSVSSNCAVYLNYDLEDAEYNYEDTTVWLFGHLQYLSVAAAFNIPDSFRLPFYTNYLFTGLMVAELIVNGWFLMNTSTGLTNTFQVMPLPASYRWKMMLLFVGSLVMGVGWEMVATRLLPKWLQNKEAKKIQQ